VIENVFRPVRRVNGKKVRARLFCGRYSLIRGAKPVTVSLHTPDEKVARKMLRDIIVEKQREAVGLIAPKSQREALQTPLSSLVDDYAAYLRGRAVSAGYLSDTVKRLQRIIAETKWKLLGDVRPDSFLRWRAQLTCSAKTVKEYQLSLGAFLNYLVRVERLERNPLAKIEHVETRGRQVRPYRAFTEDELRKLFPIAGARLLVYQVMLYTGQRPEEVAALVWDDLHLNEERPFVLVRVETTKDKDKRAVPLHPLLASALKVARPVNDHEYLTHFRPDKIDPPRKREAGHLVLVVAPPLVGSRAAAPEKRPAWRFSFKR
jgi:integrase